MIQKDSVNFMIFNPAMIMVAVTKLRTSNAVINHTQKVQRDSMDLRSNLNTPTESVGQGFDSTRWQNQHEGRAPANLALDSQLTAMTLHHMFGDGQAQACAACFTRAAAVHTVKPL